MLPVLWTLLTSRIAHLAIVALLSFSYGYHKAAVYWQSAIAAEKAQAEAAYRAEVARQEQAAREIAAAATARAEDDAALERELRRQIEAFNAQESISNATSLAPNPCLIDGAFADSLRQFDAAARRPAKPPRRPR